MPSCAQVFARTLREAGIARLYGLPGGELLEFVEATRQAGLRFLLTRHEAAASFMADAAGQLEGLPGVCAATLGPGAVNMTLGVANAFLDRSPLLAVTAAHARSASPLATHQNLDLNAVYRSFTKLTLTLDGEDTAAKVRRAIRTSLELRRGPVHIVLPSDVAKEPDRQKVDPESEPLQPAPVPAPPAQDVDGIASRLAGAKRPIVILGLDLDARTQAAAVRAFVEKLGAPVFVTPKAKGLLPEDHPLFHGVCAGVAGDAVIVDLFQRADLLLGVGFEPVESDKLWHETLHLVNVSPVSIAAGAFRPKAEAVGELGATLERLGARSFGPFAWTREELERFRSELLGVLRPRVRPRGLSGYELTRALRELYPRETVFVTDVGSVKAVTTQAWSSYEPFTFLESNGLSSMSFSLPAAMAARLHYPNRPVLCAIGDGGLGMTLAELETCLRERLHFVTVVYNDDSLSQIESAQRRRRHPVHAVRHRHVDFAAVASALGCWARKVESLDQLAAVVREAQGIDAPVVIDALVDPAEYDAQQGPLLREGVQSPELRSDP
jgi:acetolactate synthase-1/2/3 large subunit